MTEYLIIIERLKVKRAAAHPAAELAGYSK
jgi:hypothetical protein